MPNFDTERESLVREIAARGVRDPRVLEALRRVPREKFVPTSLQNLAYRDQPLPIGSDQTISQPYIVALMIEALGLRGGERVLEVGAGSGYAAAVLGGIAGEVYTIERIAQLAERAAVALQDLGYDNIHVRQGDGAAGWLEKAPFDAILVSAAPLEVPRALTSQLAVGGRLVIPVGRDDRAQELIRITRVDIDEYEHEDIADVRFVPLISGEGAGRAEEEWQPAPARVIQARPAVSTSLPGLIAARAETFSDVNSADLSPLIERVGEASVVLIGEASHGTSEFYRLREAITRRLIAEKGFTIVAAEADWPDAARIDHYVRHRDAPASEWAAFARFPTWMWRNEETRAFVDWLHAWNVERPPEARTSFHGLDLYSLYASIRAVVSYLEDVDEDLARIARERYGCLTPWEADPVAYGRASLTGAYRTCEDEVSNMLTALLEKRQRLVMEAGERDGAPFLDAVQNARLIANAERYYRTMYYGSRASWNLRDTHMFETLQAVRAHRGPAAKAVVWAHNSHIGDARATEMGRRGELNIGQLCRDAFGLKSVSIGFGTNDGTVAAASAWDGPMQIMNVRPAHPQSYERLFHMTNAPGLVLPLGPDGLKEAVDGLAKPRLERAIGVIYRPESELASHYFDAVLPDQFDEYLFIDRTTAVSPLHPAQLEGLPDTYPFGV
jgi:protein-L-isoaspartate(D-aspartate) O-methyltransferase